MKHKMIYQQYISREKAEKFLPDIKTLTCAQCQKAVPRNNTLQKYCAPCGNKVQRMKDKARREAEK